MERPSLRRRVFAAGLVAAMAALPSWAGPARDHGGALTRCMAVKGAEFGLSGAALIARRGRISTYLSGVTAGPGSAPITADTQFNLGSASKMFTAVAVAQLVEAGKATLDDPIGRYVKGLMPEASKVTVRQLLSHSSGLGDYLKPENLRTIEAARSLDDLLPLVAGETPAFAPGSRFSYSNTGYLLLGLMIERVSHQSYTGYLRAHVFGPARMTATGIEPGQPRADGMTAMTPSGGPSDGAPTALHPSPLAAMRGSSAGGMYSTVSDMKKFLSALLDGHLVSPAMVKTLTTPRFAIAPAKGSRPEIDYGFGFGTGTFEGHRWFGHNGGLPGGNTETNVFPDDQTIVEVMANRDPPMASRLYEALREVLFAPAALKACASEDAQAGSKTR